MNRRLTGPGSGSGRGKNPANPTKLRTLLSSLDKKKKAVKDSPTLLKNEKVVREALARLKLDEENTTTPIPKPEERKTSRTYVIVKPFKFVHPCPICGVVGHWSTLCPYRTRIPNNVMKVGEGYEIRCVRGVRHAVRLFCGYCLKGADHLSKECPDKSESLALRALQMPLPPTPLTE